MTNNHRHAELDVLTDALRDGTKELDRRLAAVLSYLNTSGGGRVEPGWDAPSSRASGRATSTPVGGPAA